MKKNRTGQLFFMLILITMIWGGIAAALIISEKYWWSMVPIIFLSISFRNIISYYTKTDPELLEADDKASKGGVKLLLSLVLIYAVLMTFLLYFGIRQDYLEWAAWLPAIFYFGYFYSRRRRYRREAQKRIEEKQQSVAGTREKIYDRQ